MFASKTQLFGRRPFPTDELESLIYIYYYLINNESLPWSKDMEEIINDINVKNSKADRLSAIVRWRAINHL
jgi:hypothetical protein